MMIPEVVCAEPGEGAIRMRGNKILARSRQVRAFRPDVCLSFNANRQIAISSTFDANLPATGDDWDGLGR